ncbi:MAG: efflux RND transporter periplasmic adaptor subunit [bacterium]|nr:efflux RND transporter periplasmic adaptor subunit [bacterium]
MIFLKSKKSKIWAGLILTILIIVGLSLFKGEPKLNYESIIIEPGELIQGVSVTGKVKPAQSVDLQFENSGRIASINYKAGDKVSSGAVIASLDNQDSQAQVLEKEAVLESAQADLDQTIKNLNSLNDSAISTALKTDLNNAESNLANVKKKADDDSAAVYGAGFNTMNEAMTQANTSFTFFKNIRSTYFNGLNQSDLKVKGIEESVKNELYGLDAYNRLGTEDYVKKANLEKTDENIDIALGQMLIGLTELKNAYLIVQAEVLADFGSISSTDRDKINSEAGIVSSQLSDVTSAIQNIITQKTTNDRNISDAEARLSSAKSAFPTQEDILKKQAVVKQAQAGLVSAQSQLKKSLITAPFAGTIARVDADRGETVTSSKVIVSMISASGYQVEANITEFDISKIKAGDLVSLTLDAYGPSIVFVGVVSSIEPGETVVEGVTTYKTTIDFSQNDERLRPNMTANIDIETEKKENVLSVPQRAVIIRNGIKLVRIVIGDAISELEVKTGITGQNGFVEITEGLNPGDRVITFIND